MHETSELIVANHFNDNLVSYNKWYFYHYEYLLITIWDLFVSILLMGTLLKRYGRERLRLTITYIIALIFIIF